MHRSPAHCTVLSDLEMSKVIDVLTEGEVKDNDDDRPDIVMFFSGDPTKEGNMVDVVVVENSLGSIWWKWSIIFRRRC